jgi:hypothetical protein
MNNQEMNSAAALHMLDQIVAMAHDPNATEAEFLTYVLGAPLEVTEPLKEHIIQQDLEMVEGMIEHGKPYLVELVCDGQWYGGIPGIDMDNFSLELFRAALILTHYEGDDAHVTTVYDDDLRGVVKDYDRRGQIMNEFTMKMFHLEADDKLEVRETPYYPDPDEKPYCSYSFRCAVRRGETA